jgi:hypothetical protein
MYNFNVYFYSPNQLRSFMDIAITNVNNKHPKRWWSYTKKRKKKRKTKWYKKKIDKTQIEQQIYMCHKIERTITHHKIRNNKT